MEDDELASVLLGSGSVSLCPEELSRALRRSCASGAIVPVLCGSALRGVAIQPLMDAAINYLPPASKLSSRMYEIACVMIICVSFPSPVQWWLVDFVLMPSNKCTTLTEAY